MARREILRSGRAHLGALAVTVVGLGTSACAPDRAVTGSIYPYNHQNRHPIVLAEGARKLDVFIGSGHLDPRQRAEVAGFALEYRRYGRGGILVQLPAGSPADGAAYATLEGVRAALGAGGLPSTAVSVTSYPVLDPSVASAIRLSFQRLQARVESRCGLWPKDLGVSDLGSDNRNEPYWNLGCATQANLAAQVADPLDLVRGRPETPVDTARRTRDIRIVRTGEDPSIIWKQDGNTVKRQVSQ